MSSSTEDRAALIAGLRDLADFLAVHPDVPVPQGYHTLPITIFPAGDTDDEKRAGVDAGAAALEVTADDPDGHGHYKASRAFGPLRYEVVAISTAARTRADALDSYRYSVVVDDQTVAA